jgi:hypothetical protein
MKILFDYCRQPRAYADSVGECLVLIEDGDDKEAIIADFEKPREWCAQSYSLLRELNEYTQTNYDGTVVVHRGVLLLFRTKQEFLD